jgi:hypothetical protein
MALSGGDRIGGYEIVSLIGVGRMGEVCRARDTKLNRDVASRRCARTSPPCTITASSIAI